MDRARTLLAAAAAAAAVLVACADGPSGSGGDAGGGDAGGGDGGGGDAVGDSAGDGHDGGSGPGEDAVDDAGAPPAWCEGPTAHVYTPFEADDVELFPDGLMVRDDPESPTGERLDFTPDTVPWLADAPALVQGATEALNALSGYGGLGGALLRFTGPVGGVPRSAEESLTSDGWIWADLGTTPPTRVPFDARVVEDGEDGTMVVLWPMVPLRLATEHAIVVTTAAVDADGACIAPAPATRSLVYGEVDEGEHAARYERARPRYRAAVEALDLSADAVSAITVYRTHDDLGPTRRAAVRMAEAPVAWGPWQGCEPRQTMLQCDTSTTVLDMRNASGLVDDAAVPAEAEVPVMIWLPAEPAGPVPAILFGHGLQGSRQDGWEVAKRLQGDGFAVVSMPAVEHGEHPSVQPGDSPQALLRFLALDLDTLTLDGLALRGNIDQTNLDRLRLLKLLRTQPDLDGDGTDDIDPTRVTYVGASLGAVLGAGLLALDSELDAAVLTIGGARLVSILRDQEELLSQYAPFVEALLGKGGLNRFLPLAQHVLDPADPGTWASFVLRERFDGRTPPSVLYAVGMEDEVFSPDSGALYARGLGLPQVGPVAEPVALLEPAGDAPLSGNAEAGTRTVGFFQYDRITGGDDPSPRRPTHGPSARSNESGAQIRAFLRAWAEGKAPEIIDPFLLLGTAPKPESW